MKLIDEENLIQLTIHGFSNKETVDRILNNYSDISILKYVDTMITFSEVPDEISLCINISNCPCHCKGCHSPYLAEDIGTPLTTNILDKFICENKGITCVCLMGGDSNPSYIDLMAYYIKQHYPKLKVAWYSGKDYKITSPLNLPININNFDYLKVGSYKEELGPLTSETTNQEFFKVSNGGVFENITYKFQKHEIR